MKMHLIKSFSIVSIVVVVASAVIAAIAPSKKTDNAVNQQLFSLTTSNDGGAPDITCQPTAAISERACQDDTLSCNGGSFTTNLCPPSSNQTTL